MCIKYIYIHICINLYVYVDLYVYMFLFVCVHIYMFYFLTGLKFMNSPYLS